LHSFPYQVLSRRQKTMKLLVRGKPVTVLTDRVKPAYILNEADYENTPSDGYPASTVPSPPPAPTQATRHVGFPMRFNTQANISAGGGGDVGTSHIAPGVRSRTVYLATEQ
jgi:hypothetical protein